MSTALAESGFVIDRLHEPQPTEDYRAVSPEWYEGLMTTPWFLIVRARRVGEELTSESES